jgi:hypothetical protein
MADSEQGGSRGGRRGDMSADTTQTYVRLANQGVAASGAPLDTTPSDAVRPTGLRKLWRMLWPFGRG